MKINSHRVMAVIVRHMFSWKRSLERIWDMFWWPTFNLFTWGLVTVYLQFAGTGSMFADIFLGGILMWMFVNQSQEEMGLVFLQEVWDRNLLNLMSSPLSILEFTIASIMIGIMKITVSVLWLLFLAYWLFHFTIIQYGIMLVPYAISLLLSGWALGFVINGLILRYGFRVQVFAWSLSLLVQPFSAVFFPLSILPPWMQVVARVIPTSYIFEGMRKVMQQGMIDYQGLWTAFFLNGIYLALGIWFFARSYYQSRSSGMLVKFG